MKKVYVIRFLNCEGGETDSGTFEYCYENEDDARKNLEEDFENTLKEVKAKWKGEEEEKHIVLHKLKKDGDYAGITVECGNYDYYDWFIECLPVVEGGK